MTQTSTALRGIYSVLSFNLFTQEYPAMKRTNIPGALVALFTITLGCGGDAPGETYERDNLQFNVQYPEACNQATGAPAFCNEPIEIGVKADYGDNDKSGVIDPFNETVILTRTGLTATATLANVPVSNEQQVIRLDLQYQTFPTEWRMESGEGGDAPKHFYLYPKLGDEGTMINLRIVAVGGKGAMCVNDNDCADMQVCIAGMCTGGNGEGEGCGVNDPCLDGLSCVDNKCIDPCLSDAECGAKEICNDDGKCIAVPCKMDSDCADGEWCDEPTNTCNEGCSQNSDCPNGQTCDTVKHECVDPTPECTTNDQCGEKQICDDMMCVDVECTTNEHCADNEICNLVDHTCKQIDQGDFCTRPLWDTNDPDLDKNQPGNFMWAFGQNEMVRIGRNEIGFKAVMGDETKCLELTQAQKDSMQINLTLGPKYNNVALCTKPNVNDPTEIKCDGTNLPNNEIPTGSFEVTGSFGKGVLTVGVTKDNVYKVPNETLDLTALEG